MNESLDTQLTFLDLGQQVPQHSPVCILKGLIFHSPVF